MATGSFSPCLDFSHISTELNSWIRDADCVVIEGMGRAIHTNYKTRFTCDSLKIAVFKNPFVASELNVNIFDGMALFESGAK